MLVDIITSFKAKEITSFETINKIVSEGYNKTGCKFSLTFIGSKGYLDSVIINCEMSSDTEDNLLPVFNPKSCEANKECFVCYSKSKRNVWFVDDMEEINNIKEENERIKKNYSHFQNEYIKSLTSICNKNNFSKREREEEIFKLSDWFWRCLDSEYFVLLKDESYILELLKRANYDLEIESYGTDGTLMSKDYLLAYIEIRQLYLEILRMFLSVEKSVEKLNTNSEKNITEDDIPF